MNKIKIKPFTNGKVIPLSKVNDYVFSNKLVGDGFAIEPTSDTIVSPTFGEIIMIFPTKHAIGIRRNDGLEFLLHFGIDTVELNGEGFNLYCSVGDIINEGDILGKIDINLIKSKGFDPTSMLCVSESKNIEVVPLNIDLEVTDEISLNIIK